MTPLERAAASFGGRQGLAKAMGVSYMVVCQWFYRRRVPVERAVKIEQITNGAVTAAELRPDVFKSKPSKPKPKTKAA